MNNLEFLVCPNVLRRGDGESEIERESENERWCTDWAALWREDPHRSIEERKSRGLARSLPVRAKHITVRRWLLFCISAWFDKSWKFEQKHACTARHTGSITVHPCIVNEFLFFIFLCAVTTLNWHNLERNSDTLQKYMLAWVSTYWFLTLPLGHNLTHCFTEFLERVPRRKLILNFHFLD